MSRFKYLYRLQVSFNWYLIEFFFFKKILSCFTRQVNISFYIKQRNVGIQLLIDIMINKHTPQKLVQTIILTWTAVGK